MTQRGNVRDWKIRKVLIQSFTVSWKFGIVSQISAKMLKFEQRVSQMTMYYCTCRMQSNPLCVQTFNNIEILATLAPLRAKLN